MNVAWGDMAHFMAGFVSQTYPDQAYIHFVGIEANYRGRSLGRQLYSTFFETVRRLGCTTVRCISSPVNSGSIAFHTRMGFRIERSNGERNGAPCTLNYELQGADRLLFVRSLL
jgi:ribosomal protein S18 acetylase RimI-like enzyme